MNPSKIFSRARQMFGNSLVVYLSVTFAIMALLGWTFRQVLLMDGTQGPPLIQQTWPAGTFLANFPEGDRINTYHRNYLMIAGQEGTGIWDISNPTNPERLRFNGAGNNGHRWWKIGDLYWREYSVPEVDGTQWRYLDLSDMFDLKPVTSSGVLFTVENGNPRYDKLETFPHTIESGKVYDMRSGETLGDLPVVVNRPDIVLRLGNYVFYVPQTGEITVYDLGDPMNVKYLGSFGGDVPKEQYSTGIQLWRNYLIYMSGNAGDNSLVAFDISDPANVTHAFNISSDDITLGRYMIFQDEFGFTGRFDRGVKYNFEKMEVAQEFFPPADDEVLQFLDNQWMPIGNIVVASGDGKTSIFSHQDELDTRPPSVGFHFPRPGETNLPVTTTIGFVISEVIDDLTLNDTNIQVSPLGGEPIEADVSSSSYQVTNYAPKEPLLPNTTYEVKFIEGGIKDAVGNGMEEYVFYFTTGGDESNQSPVVAGITADIASPVLTGTSITFTADASDPDGNPLSYRWDFGDGSPKTAWTEATVSHTYQQDGNYLVQVQVSDDNGGFTVGSTPVNAVEVMPSHPPAQSGPMAVDEINRVVWVVNPDNNTVSRLDADDLTLLEEIPVPGDPVGVALDAQKRAWITCRDADRLVVLTPGGAVGHSLQLDHGSAPYGIVFTPDGSRGFVSAFGAGKVLEVSAISIKVVSSLEVGSTPRAMAITPGGNSLLVTQFISQDEGGKVWKIDLGAFTIEKVISLPLDDFTADNGNQARGVPNYVAGVAVHPYNQSAWTVAKKDNILRGYARDGQALTFDNAVRTALSRLDLATGNEVLAERMDIDNHGQPSSAIFSPTGNYLFVTMQGNNHLVAIDPKKGLELFQRDVGRAPQGLVIDPVTHRIFVKNFMDRTVTVFDGEEMLTSGAAVLNELSTIRTVQQEKLSAEVLKGKRIFYNAADQRMGADGYMSCAGCHIDGTQDGRTWDFTNRGEGLRNTISLRGRAGTGHGRVHWSANFDEIHDFENDMRFHFNGQGFMADANFNEGTTALSLGDKKAGKSPDLDALVAYVESLDSFDPSPYRNNDGTLTAEAIAGKDIFTNLQCNTCHGGDNFTDSYLGRRHDVGTLKATSGNRLGKTLVGLDVPTLRDVWATAPYLHDGSAATLKDVLTTQNPGDAHSAASALSAYEMDQLVAYLKQLDGSERGIPNDRLLHMASPTDGVNITTSDPVDLQINSNIEGITKVVYYADDEEIATSDTAPFSGQWQPIIWKEYHLFAKVFYNQGKTASITPEIKVKYKKTMDVMFVVGDKDLTSEDLRVKSRLEQTLGFNIHIFADEEADSPEKANPFDMVLVSSSVEPSVLGNDLESAIVPVMTWDPFMYGRLALTSGPLNTGFGFTPQAYEEVTLADTSHPMAAGLRAPGVKLYQIVQKMPFGQPAEDAIVILKAGGYPILFGYESGGSANSRRVAFPLRDQFLHLLSEEGWKLFDAAVLWTLHGGNAETPVQQLPDVRFVSPADGELVNSPLDIRFETENWDLPSSEYKLRFRINGQDRGLVSSDAPFTDGTTLSEGPHTLTFQMERSNNFPMSRGDTITVIVTNDPLPEGPSVIIQSPFDGSLLSPSFDIEFSTYKWDIAPGGKHIKYFIDGVEAGAVFEIAPIKITDLPEGQHTLTLALAEEDGQLTGSEESVTVTVSEAVAGLPDTPFMLKYYDNSTGPLDPEVKPVFSIVNDSSASIPYSDFKIRYWYTPEHSGPLRFNADYSSIPGATGLAAVTAEGEHYMEISFTTLAGLPANSASGPVQLRLHHTAYQTQNQSNDFSYDGAKKSLSPHIKATLYYKDERVWGLEPGPLGPVNQKPGIVLVTSALKGNVPLEVTFDASQSFDPDGTIASYLWDFGDGTTANTSLVTHTYTTGGVFDVKLTLTDDLGAISIETLAVVANDPTVNHDPVAGLQVSSTSGSVPLKVTLDASASTDQDGDELAFSWDFGNGQTGSGEVIEHTYNVAGEYNIVLTVTDGNGGMDQAEVKIVASEVIIGGCNFDTPIPTALPSIDNNSYEHVHVLGSGGPDLSNVTNVTVNWNLQGNGLHQFSISTSNGDPSWWNDLIPAIDQTFREPSPGMTIAGSGFSGLDGEYHVNKVGDDFVMVSKAYGFSLYFSNSPSAPGCAPASARVSSGSKELSPNGNMLIYPTMAKSRLWVKSNDKLSDMQWQIHDSAGRLHANGTGIKGSIDISGIHTGLYFLRITNNGKETVFRFFKQ